MRKQINLLEPEASDEASSSRVLEGRLVSPTEERITGEPPSRVGGVVIGRLIGFRNGDDPLVTYGGQPGSAAITARTVIDLLAEHIGQAVVLAFENGDDLRPIIMGRMRTSSPSVAADRPLQVEVDSEGRRLTLSAEEQLVLRCGKASITLTNAGKLVIKGAYVSNQSSGVLRIKGGSVQIN